MQVLEWMCAFPDSPDTFSHKQWREFRSWWRTAKSTLRSVSNRINTTGYSRELAAFSYQLKVVSVFGRISGAAARSNHDPRVKDPIKEVATKLLEEQPMGNLHGMYRSDTLSHDLCASAEVICDRYKEDLQSLDRDWNKWSSNLSGLPVSSAEFDVAENVAVDRLSFQLGVRIHVPLDELR